MYENPPTFQPSYGAHHYPVVLNGIQTFDGYDDDSYGVVLAATLTAAGIGRIIRHGGPKHLQALAERKRRLKRKLRKSKRKGQRKRLQKRIARIEKAYQRLKAKLNKKVEKRRSKGKRLTKRQQRSLAVTQREKKRRAAAKRKKADRLRKKFATKLKKKPLPRKAIGVGSGPTPEMLRAQSMARARIFAQEENLPAELAEEMYEDIEESGTGQMSDEMEERIVDYADEMEASADSDEVADIEEEMDDLDLDGDDYDDDDEDEDEDEPVALTPATSMAMGGINPAWLVGGGVAVVAAIWLMRRK